MLIIPLEPLVANGTNYGDHSTLNVCFWQQLVVPLAESTVQLVQIVPLVGPLGPVVGLVCSSRASAEMIPSLEKCCESDCGRM